MIVYFSRTGNVKHICESLALPYTNENEYKNEEFILFTYTDGVGKLPLQVAQFMRKHGGMCRGVLTSGNSNFGSNYCMAGKIVSRQYRVPLGPCFDLRGTEENIKQARAFYGRVFN